MQRSSVVVFSGEGPISHSDARDLARRLGCEVSGGVREGVDLLVVGEEPSSLKVRQAEKFGVPVVTYDQWIAESGAAALIAEASRDDGVLHVPSAYPDDVDATESQTEGVRTFYTSQALDDLTADQAGALLDYRDFARAAVQKLHNHLYGEQARSLAEQISIYISRRRGLAEEVVRLMRKRFESGADPDRLPSAIGRTEAFEDIVTRFG